MHANPEALAVFGLPARLHVCRKMFAQTREKHLALIVAISAQDTRPRLRQRTAGKPCTRVQTRSQRIARGARRALQQVVERRHIGCEHCGRALHAGPLHIMQQHAERAHLAQYDERDQQCNIAREHCPRQRSLQ